MIQEKKQEKESPAKAFLGAVKLVLQNLNWRLAAGLLAAIFVLIFCGWLTSEVFEGEAAAFDDAVRGAINQTSSPAMTATFVFFTRLGSIWGIAPLFVLATMIFIGWRRKRFAALLWSTMTGEIILNFVLKNAFQRPRPESFFDFPLPQSYSYPSGHAFASLCLFGMTAWLVSGEIKNGAVKLFIWLTALFLILMIGLSRIYLGVHYPSDVLAGYATGLIWLATVIYADRLHIKKYDSQ